MRMIAWVRFALLVGVVLIMGASCSIATSGASRRTTPTPDLKEYVIPGDAPSGVLAATFCQNGRAVTQISGRDTLPAILLEEIWEHEWVHIQQLQANPRQTCEETAQERWSNPLFYATDEANAACAQIRWAYYKARLAGDPLKALLRQAASVTQRFRLQWQLPVSEVEVATLFIRVCPFVTVVEPRR